MGGCHEGFIVSVAPPGRAGELLLLHRAGTFRARIRPVDFYKRCADCLNYSAMRLGVLPNGSWRILRAKHGANDEGFLVAASGIHGFNSVGGDLGNVYVVAAQMSCGEVALLSRHRRPLAPLNQPRWSKIVKRGTAKSFDEALTRSRKSKSLNLPVAHAVAVASVEWGRRKPATSAAEPGGHHSACTISHTMDGY